MLRPDDTYLKNDTCVNKPHRRESANHQSSTLIDETAHDTRVDAVRRESFAAIPLVPRNLPAVLHRPQEKESQNRTHPGKKRKERKVSVSDYNRNPIEIPRASRDGK